MTLGVWLKEQRIARKLSLRELARRSGLSHPSLMRWETDTFLPRVPELEAALMALEVTGEQRRHALTLLQKPRALAPLEAEKDTSSARPCGGDLLRAMRLRQGRSQGSVARAVGVSMSTLSRWERSETWPDTEQLHALCFHLEAREEELVALTRGRFTLGYSADPIDLSSREIEGDLAHLKTLSIMCRLWPLLPHSLEARLLFAHYGGYYARLLLPFSPAEAKRQADNVLEMRARDRANHAAWARDFGWPGAIIVRAQVASQTTQGYAPEEGFHVLRRLLPIVEEPVHRAWMLSDMTRFHFDATGDFEQARKGSDAAIGLVADYRDPAEADNRRKEQVRLCLKAGRMDDALALLPSSPLLVHPTEHADLADALDWVELCLRLGLPQEAHRFLLAISSHVAASGYENLHHRMEALQRQV